MERLMRTVEIRSFQLKPGARAEFHRLATERSIPMLRRWGTDVVAHGCSRHDSDSYYVIRSYASLEERQSSQDAFYGSDEWRKGPREAILALIEHYTDVVLVLDETTIDGLRKTMNDGRTHST
jgi:hypothetical protein